jgi:phenylacetate-CoA ligase
MIYNSEYETMAREDLKQLQIERLQAVLYRVYRNVTFYREAFDRLDLDIDDVKDLKDLSRLPFTTKEDLKKAYPYNMFAVPLRDIVRLHTTSGTTGKPLVVGYTRNDLRSWASLVARVLSAVDIGPDDFIQIAFPYTLTTGGLGFHYGAERIGASVIPASSSDIRRQAVIMRDYKSTALVSTPGYALHLASILKDMDLHPEELSLKTGLFGSEPWSDRLREQIETELHITAYDNYGLTEIMGPGVAFESIERDGLFISEDHFIPEIIDPETRAPLPFGERGELVLTTITKEGFPLIRFRTGDITSLTDEPGASGRSFCRMKRVSGRTDDMIIVEGVNCFPSQIEEILVDVEGVEPHYLLILDREDGIDKLEVQVEMGEKVFSDEAKVLEKLRNRLEEAIRTGIGIEAKVTLKEPKEIERSEGGKLKHLIDKREL